MTRTLARPVDAAHGMLAPPARRRAVLALVLVAAVGLVAHAVLVGFDRPINWDEAVHFTQVVPGRPAVFMEPHRTRGMSLLVAPIGVLDPSMTTLRLVLALAGAVGTVAAFRPWVRLVGMAAPLAAAVYSAFWVTVFYSVEVLPNHPTALLLVGLLGVVLGMVERGPTRRGVVTAAVLVLVAALVRPPDALLVGAAIAVTVLALRPRDAVRILLPMAAAGLVAMAAWWVEGWVRFGFGPITTMRSATDYGTGGVRINQLPLYLRGMGNQLRCADACQAAYLEAGGGWSLPTRGMALFLLACLVLAVVAVVGASPAQRRVILPIALSVVGFLGFYGWSGGAMNLRYLLPLYALALLVPALGAVVLWRLVGRLAALGGAGRALSTIVRGAGVVVLVLTLAWQADEAYDRLNRNVARGTAAALGTAVGELADGAPCVVAADVYYPQIQYWSRCMATVLARGSTGELQPPLGTVGSYVDLSERAAAGERVFAVSRRARLAGSPAEAWVEHPLPSSVRDDYVLLELPAGAPVPPPPCNPDPDRVLAGLLGEPC